MTIPAFNDFLSDLDTAKLIYDLDLYSPTSLKEGVPFTDKQATAITQTSLAITKAILAQYHQWLAEQLL